MKVSTCNSSRPYTHRAPACSYLLTLGVLGPLAGVVCVDGPDVDLGGHLAAQVGRQVSSTLQVQQPTYSVLALSVCWVEGRASAVVRMPQGIVEFLAVGQHGSRAPATGAEDARRQQQLLGRKKGSVSCCLLTTTKASAAALQRVDTCDCTTGRTGQDTLPVGAPGMTGSAQRCLPPG